VPLSSTTPHRAHPRLSLLPPPHRSSDLRRRTRAPPALHTRAPPTIDPEPPARRRPLCRRRTPRLRPIIELIRERCVAEKMGAGWRKSPSAHPSGATPLASPSLPSPDAADSPHRCPRLPPPHPRQVTPEIPHGIQVEAAATHLIALSNTIDSISCSFCAGVLGLLVT
jgi:hypothetical protein